MWFKELVLNTLLQHTMISCEDNVATNPLTMNIVVSSIILTRNTCTQQPLARPYAICACRMKRQLN